FEHFMRNPQKKNTDTIKMPPLSKLNKSIRHHIDKDREQTHLMIGFPALDWLDKDRYALDLIGHILGGQGGRLFLNLRDEQSLCYSVAPLTMYGCAPGYFGCYIATSPEKFEAAVAGLWFELGRLKKELVSEAEFDRALNYIQGSHAIEHQHGD